jgi:hypothetical protein
VVVLVNLALTRLNVEIFGLASYEISVESAPFLASCGLLAVSIWLALAWWIPPSLHIDATAHRKQRRLLLGALAAFGLGPMIGTASIQELRKRAAFSLRQLPFRIMRTKPRFYKSKRARLTTTLVCDGFLYNPKSRRWHFVGGGVVSSVRTSERAATSFAKFMPASEQFKLARAIERPRHPSKNPGAHTGTKIIKYDAFDVANGHRIVALERSASWLAADGDYVGAMNSLFHAFEEKGRPASAPARMPELRLLDLYAKIAASNFDDAALQRLLDFLRMEGLASKIPERFSKWSNRESKWRKKFQHRSRSSKAGYPVTNAGQCAFESRPTPPLLTN